MQSGNTWSHKHTTIRVIQSTLLCWKWKVCSLSVSKEHHVSQTHLVGSVQVVIRADWCALNRYYRKFSLVYAFFLLASRTMASFQSSLRYRNTHSLTHTHTERERETDWETERQRETETETERQRERQREKEGGVERNWKEVNDLARMSARIHLVW